MSDEEVAEKKLTAAQKAKVERNRQKALLLRQARLASKPYTVDKAGRGGKSQSTGRVVDTGAGFFLEEEESISHVEKKITHPQAPVMQIDSLLCEDCSKEFLQSFLHDKFELSVCDTCREDKEKYPLITKTEARDKYLLKDVDFDKRDPPLQFIVRKNKKNPKWGDMKLYLESQVYKRALEVWESEDGIEAAREKRTESRDKTKQKRYEKKIKDLRMAVRSSLWRKETTHHEHEYGPEFCIDEDDDLYGTPCQSFKRIPTDYTLKMVLKEWLGSCGWILKMTAICIALPLLMIEAQMDTSRANGFTSHVTAIVGEDATLPCTLEGGYVPQEVSWIRKTTGRHVMNGYSYYKPRYGISQSDSSSWDLQIHEVTLDDTGVYICKDGDSKTEVQLRVTDEKMAKGMKINQLQNATDVETVEVISGSSFEFRCVTDLELDEIFWYFSHPDKKTDLLGIGTADYNKDVHVTTEYGKPKLTIKIVDQTNAGLYMCKNRKKEELFSKRLVVLEPVKIPDYSKDLTVMRGASSIIWCNATGNPKPEITWYKRIPDGQDSKDDDLNENGPSLILGNITVNCVGTYVCKATHKIYGDSRTAEKSIRVTVLYKPIVIVDKLGHNKQYSERLMCTVLANPNATGVWTVEGESPLPGVLETTVYFRSGEAGDTEGIARSLLGFNEGLSKTENYTCTATNTHGTTQKHIYMEI
ncbi:hypothetical protein ScPMuIL_018917 [Solemya velum]